MASFARAQDRPPEAAPRSAAKQSSPEQAADPKLREAKDLFHAGVALLNSNDPERALEMFRKSRTLVPSRQNTINAAICLERLERYDEALEVYEAALIEFQRELTPDVRVALAPKLAELRDRIGSVELSANVDGKVIVDGRERGVLPLGTPLRLLPGAHTLRIVKDGYQTFEGRPDIVVKQTLRLDAQLKVLASAGRLRVESPESEGADLRIDGAAVGQLPWEGTLAPGRHLYEAIQGDSGTGPQGIVVLQGQTALVRAKMHPLGGSVKLLVTPPGALLAVDGVGIDNAWEGRLPVGTHRLSAQAEGYAPAAKALSIDTSTAGEFEVTLPIDPKHPRWARPSLAWVDAFGAYAISPSLGSDAEACSPSACSGPDLAKGFTIGARGAYELAARFSLEISAGFLRLQTEVVRSVPQHFEDGSPGGTDVRYELVDHLRLQGAFFSAGVGFRIPFGSRLALQTRAHVGALISSAKDEIGATLVAADGSVQPATVEGSGTATSAIVPLLQPELQMTYRASHLRIGWGVSVLFGLVSGPSNDNGDLHPVNGCPNPHPTPLPAECVAGSNAVANEKLFGPFVAVMPGVSAGYEF